VLPRSVRSELGRLTIVKRGISLVIMLMCGNIKMHLILLEEIGIGFEGLVVCEAFIVVGAAAIHGIMSKHDYPGYFLSIIIRFLKIVFHICVDGVSHFLWIKIQTCITYFSRLIINKPIRIELNEVS
jgi:hypothetical protein